MDSFAPTTLDAPRHHPGRTLAHLIERSFAPTTEPAYSFQEAFRVFAEAYFTCSLDENELLQRPILEAPALDALTHAFSEAVAAGELASFHFPVRLTASMVLTSLASLRRQVTDGMLAPAEAADVLTTLLIDGLQVPTYPL